MNKVSHAIILFAIFLGGCRAPTEVVEQNEGFEGTSPAISVATAAPEDTAAPDATATPETTTTPEAFHTTAAYATTVAPDSPQTETPLDTIVPASTEPAADTITPAPTAPAGYRYTVLEKLLIVEVKGDVPGVGMPCGSVLVYAIGLVENETDLTLETPRIFIEAFSGAELIKRFSLGQSYGRLVPPGGRAVFSSNRPKCQNFSVLEGRGYDLEDLRYEVVLYADPPPGYYPLVPYSDMQIVSVKEEPREEGTRLEVTVANTGSELAYPDLNFLYYDEGRNLVDANMIFVSSDIEPWDALYPGTEGKVILFMPSEGVEYEFILLGEARIDE